MTGSNGLGISADELAGIVGLFGAMTPTELQVACLEIVYKDTGERPAETTVQAVIDDALASYHLVSHDSKKEPLLIPGPAAFPTLPPFAEDLHHLLDVDQRDVDRTDPARALVEDLEAEVQSEPDASRIAQIEQLSYDLEAWADVDASSLRNSEDGET